MALRLRITLDISSCGCLFCACPYFGGSCLHLSPSGSSPSAPPFSAPSTVSVASSLPSRVSPLGVGDGLRWVLLRWWLRLLQDFFLFCSLCSSVCDSSCGSSFFSISFLASGCLGASLLPSAPFPWPVSLALALCSYLVVRGFHGCFRVLPLLCYTLSPVSALRCCPLHQLSLCFALLRRAPLRVHLALPLLPRSPLWPWWLCSSAWSFFCLSSAVWGFCDSFHPPLSVSGYGPAVPLLLVVGPVAPGAAALVPEALVPHL